MEYLVLLEITFEALALVTLLALEVPLPTVYEQVGLVTFLGAVVFATLWALFGCLYCCA